MRDHLIEQLTALKATGSYQIFSSFVRNGLVRHWLCQSLDISAYDMTAALVDLDNREAELLPETIDDIAPKTTKKLRAVFEFVKVQLRKKQPQWLADAICGGREVSTKPPLCGGIIDAALPFLNLPIPSLNESLAKVSPTRLDSYLRCPFTFFLKRKDVLGDKRLDDRVDCLAMWEYGNIVHGALETWGLSPLKDSTDEREIAAFLALQVDAQLTDRFGSRLPTKVVPQGESAKARLTKFAAVQAKRRAEGWKIVEVERKLDMMLGHTKLYGKCDRIDFNERTNEWCVIDYKVWVDASKAICYDEQTHEWRSLQLPLYCEMLANAIVGDSIPTNLAYSYCVLGVNDVVFTSREPRITNHESLTKAQELIALIERGIFWPPSPRNEWKRDYGDWLAPDPAAVISPAWLADQLARQ